MKFMCTVLVLLFSNFVLANPSVLCDSNEELIRFSKGPVQRDVRIIEVLTWNVLKFQRPNSFSDLMALSNKSDITFVQEAVHSAENQTNATQSVAMDWTFYKSFCRDYGATGVQTGSRFPQVQADALLAPAIEPIVKTPKVTGFSTIEIQGVKVLLINVHGLNANKGLDFEKHMDQITEVAKTFNGPIIWAGDFNTWNPLRTAYLNSKAKELSMVMLKPEVDTRKNKLDHILIRGFRAKSVTVLDTYQSSDHFPVRAELEFSP